MKSIFITGTDTNIGKTYVATALLKQFNLQGFTTFGIKPIASGCQLNATGEWVNDDALQLQAAASLWQPYSTVNPIVLREQISPHLAAEHEGLSLSIRGVTEKLTISIQANVDINIIEGVGGWFVPLNDRELMSDFICSLNIPIILVVGIKLGCLSHSILTARAILQQKGKLIGWIANCVDPTMLYVDENIETLKQWLPVPCLGVMPYDGQRQQVFSDQWLAAGVTMY